MSADNFGCKDLCHGIKCDPAKRQNVLLDRLRANLPEENGNMALEMEVEEIICAIGLKNVKARSELVIAEEGNRATDVRLELQEVPEGRVIKDAALQFVAIHRCKCAKSTVHGNIVGSDDLIIAIS